MTTKKTNELRDHVIAAAVALAILAFGFWLIGEVVDDSATPPAAPLGEGQRLTAIDMHTYGSRRPTAAQLMADHGCWTMRDGAPGNVDGLPGGAIIRVNGGDPEYTTNALAIGAALDAALDGADNGVEAIAFCRGDW